VSENLYDDLLSMPTDYICGTDHSYLIVCCEQVWTYNHRINFDYWENQYLKLIPWSWHFFQERWAEEELFAISDEFIAGVLGE
jgi:hypothetical protein